MIIEEGKRYVRQDGGLTPKIRYRKKHDPWFPFTDGRNLYSMNGGCCLISGAHRGYDLISEYKENTMKEIDFEKPLRFVDNADELKYIGLDSLGFHVVEIVSVNALMQVDRYGKAAGWQDVENIPEKLVRWVNFYKNGRDGGVHPTKVDADRCATANRIACIGVEFEPGEGL